MLYTILLFNIANANTGYDTFILQISIFSWILSYYHAYGYYIITYLHTKTFDTSICYIYRV